MSNASELGLPSYGNNFFHWSSRINLFLFAFSSFFFSLLIICGSVPGGWKESKNLRETYVPPSINNLDIFVPFDFSSDGSSTLGQAIWNEWLKKDDVCYCLRINSTKFFGSQWLDTSFWRIESSQLKGRCCVFRQEVFFFLPWIQMRCLLVRWTNNQMFCRSKLRHQYQCDFRSDKQNSNAVSKNTFGSNCQRVG